MRFTALEGQNNSGIMCKIIKAQNFAFAVWGLERIDLLYKFEDSVFAYIYEPAKDLLDSAMRISRDVYKIMEIFKQFFPFVITQFITLMESLNKHQAGDTLNNSITGVVFAINNGKSIKAFFYNFIPYINLNGEIKIEIASDSIIGGIDDSLHIVALGYTDEIEPLFIKQNWDNVEAAINNLINIEINAYPDYVGSPINIIRITKNQVKWIQKNQPCK